MNSLALLLIVFGGVEASNGAAVSTEALLRARVHEFARAWAKSDVETLDRLLAPEYTHTDFGGKVLDRAGWLAYAKEPRDLVIDTEDLRIKVFNEVGVVTGYNRIADAKHNNRVLEIRFTQVWLLTSEGWKRSFFQATPIITRSDKW